MNSMTDVVTRSATPRALSGDAAATFIPWSAPGTGTIRMFDRAPTSAMSVAAFPNVSRSPWSTSTGISGVSSSSQPRLLWTAGRVQGEGEADDACGTDVAGRSAGDTGAGAPTADHERQAAGEVRDHRCRFAPRDIEGGGPCGHPATRDPPRLLVARHGDAPLRQHAGKGCEIDGSDATACTVTEPEDGAGVIRSIHDQPAGAERGRHVDIHGSDATRAGVSA